MSTTNSDRLDRVPAELQANEGVLTACWLVQTAKCVTVASLQQANEIDACAIGQLLELDILRLEWDRLMVTDLGLQLLGPLADSAAFLPLLNASLDGAAGMALAEMRKSLALLGSASGVDAGAAYLANAEPDTRYGAASLWSYRVAAACITLPEPVCSLAVVGAIRAGHKAGELSRAAHARRMLSGTSRVFREAGLPIVEPPKGGTLGSEFYSIPVLQSWTADAMQELLSAYKTAYSIVACAATERELHVEKPWAGGFSYATFYQEARTLAKARSVRLASACLSSPGWIELELPGSYAEALSRAIHAIIKKDGLYDALYSEAGRRELLGADIRDNEVETNHERFIAKATADMQGVLQTAFPIESLAKSLRGVKRMRMLFGVFRQLGRLADYQASGTVRL